VARRVVRHVTERDREAVLANLEEAVRITGARSDVTVAVHPIDAETARIFARSLMKMSEEWKHVRIAEEPEVSPGGCRVQWNGGALDASIETQLERIEAALRDNV
jgi:flagellar assembly protein FliH